MNSDSPNTADIERRLKPWRQVVKARGPEWLTANAPMIVVQLEAELAASFGPEPVIPLSSSEKKMIRAALKDHRKAQAHE